MTYYVEYCTCPVIPVEHFTVFSKAHPENGGVCCTTRLEHGGAFDMSAVMEEDARRRTFTYRWRALFRRLFQRR